MFTKRIARSLSLNVQLRRIGYASFNPTEKFNVKEYDPLKIPNLFSELDPADIETEYDEDGGRMTGMELALKKLHKEYVTGEAKKGQ